MPFHVDLFIGNSFVYRRILAVCKFVLISMGVAHSMTLTPVKQHGNKEYDILSTPISTQLFLSGYLFLSPNIYISGYMQLPANQMINGIQMTLHFSPIKWNFFPIMKMHFFASNTRFLRVKKCKN